MTRKQVEEVVDKLLMMHPRAAACVNACQGIPDPAAAIEAAREHLREIAAKKGPFSLDPHEHAKNCVEYMAEHARAALALLDAKHEA